MRKEWVVFGIILLFIGLIITSATASIQQERINARVELDHKTDSTDLFNNVSDWWIAGNFSRGRRLYLNIQPGRNPEWTTEPPTLHNLIYPLYVPVTITDPHGGETKLRVIFGSYPSDLEQHVSFWAVNVTSNDGGLIFEKSNEWQIDGITYYQELRAVVNYDGIFNATVHRALGMWGPPSILSLESLIIEIEYPYWFVIPIGATFMIVGVFLSIWATKFSKH